MSEPLVMPCGCRRGIVKRIAPAFDESGVPRMENGAFVMAEVEELQESYCAEHTKVLVERQYEAHRALEAGASPDDVLLILAGASPLPALTDGKEP